MALYDRDHAQTTSVYASDSLPSPDEFDYGEVVLPRDECADFKHTGLLEVKSRHQQRQLRT